MLLEDTQNPAVRPASTRTPSVATTMAGRKRAFRHAEAPASVAVEGSTAVAAEGFTAAVAGVGNRSFNMSQACKTSKWRDATCGE